MNQNKLPNNSVCIDTSALAKTAFSLSQKFSLVEFIDFCSLIEQLVLRDALILTGSANAVQKCMLERIQPWLKSGAIILAHEKPRPVKLPNLEKVNLLGAHPDFADHDKTRQNDARYETSRLIAAQECFQRPAMPLVRNYRDFDEYVKPDICQMAFNLAAKYEEQVQQIHNFKIHINQHVPNYTQIQFPPIAIQILKEAKSFDDLVKLALQFRSRYQQLRHKINELEESQRDPALSVIEKQNELNGWVESWNKNITGSNSGTLIFGQTSVGLTSGIAAIGAGLAQSQPSQTLAGGVQTTTSLIEIIKKVSGNKHDRLLQPIRSAFMGSLRTSQPEIKQRVESIFNYDPRRFDELLSVACFSEESTLSALVDNEMKIRIMQDQ